MLLRSTGMDNVEPALCMYRTYGMRCHNTMLLSVTLCTKRGRPCGTLLPPLLQVGGNGLSDVPHMLVWGGEGTRMDADIQAMLRKWTPSLRREARGEAGPGAELGGGGQGTGSAVGAGGAREEGQTTAGRL